MENVQELQLQVLVLQKIVQHQQQQLMMHAKPIHQSAYIIHQLKNVLNSLNYALV